MQNRPMANKIFQCDFLLQLLFHILYLVMNMFLSRAVLQGKIFGLFQKKGLSLDFFETQDLSCPDIHLQKLCSTYAWRIFCLPMRLNGPVKYVRMLCYYLLLCNIMYLKNCYISATKLIGMDSSYSNNQQLEYYTNTF